MPDYSKRVIVPPKRYPVSLENIPEQHRARFLNPGEIEVLVALIFDEQHSFGPVDTMVEFGCQNGRTARVLLDHCRDIGRYIGIDVPASYVTPEAVQRAECPANPGELAFSDSRFRLIMAGRGSRDLVVEDLAPIAVAFIDGDHSYEGVQNDFNLSMKAGADLIIFHDDHLLETVGVHRFLDDLSDTHRVHHVDGTWISYVRM